MEKLKLKAPKIGTQGILTREQLKKVMGGDASVTYICHNLSGNDLAACNYNVCMSGYVYAGKSQDEIKQKTDNCVGQAQDAS